MSRYPRRVAAFTLVELLVVIAIIGVLVSLLLPAVQQAREAARKTHCTSNLKQVALALQNYHDSHNLFPYGYRGEPSNVTLRRDTWFHRLLPYVDQTNLFERYVEEDPDYVWQGSADVHGASIPVFMCPSDPSMPAQGGASATRCFQGSYVGLYGKNHITNSASNSTGMFWYHSNAAMRDVVDGISKTILLSEVIARGTPAVSGAWGAGGGYWGSGPHGGGYAFTALEPPNPLLEDVIYTCKSTIWPQAPCRSVVGLSNREIYARSYHPGGVNVALVDGSVHFVGNSTDRDIFHAMGTRAGGEIIDP
ncbi:Type II secretion system protein G precursor [Planctomycetes bacterium Pan216]|uniref:Type II secretion system protein G n=1 Tax=Kolteria novifilia TaxID=2527975 RepID=A0A518B4T8_9BACT|nr:Type II secretion system protein G precursor [Planctomycetes bacterium Pan216]